MYAWRERKRERDEEWTQAFYQQDKYLRMNAWSICMRKLSMWLINKKI